MSNFISEIKKIPPAALIYQLSKQSIIMFRQQDFLLPFKVQTVLCNKIRNYDVSLSSWDILNIEYLCVCNSNDYRNPSRAKGLGKLIELYRDYENRHSVADQIENAEFSDLMRFLTGMTAEQFMYENLSWAFQAFNRNYYIFTTIQNRMGCPLIDMEKIVQGIFSIGTDDYIVIMMIIMWLCMQHPNPLSAPEHLYKHNEYTCLTKENIAKVIQYYSCDYETIRKNTLRKQLFYSKPFIETTSPHDYIACNIHLVIMTVGTGLYWLARDYYRNQSNYFVNSFGLLFEEYIKDISNTACRQAEFSTLEKKNGEKSADYLYEFNHFRMIVEAKSTLISLGAKQQIPNKSMIDTFIARAIFEAYDQLEASYNKIESDKADKKPIIKIILLYDVFSNTALIQHSAAEIFDKDLSCFVMTIRELEILLMLYQNQRTLFDQVTISLLEKTQSGNQQRYSITSLFQSFNLWKYDFFQGEKDCFRKLMIHMKEELGD